MCNTHYRRHLNGGDITTPIRVRRKVAGVLERSADGGKMCTSCSHWKPLEGFYRGAKFADGYHPYCKDCDRFKTILRRYGLSQEQYEELEAAQNNSCAVCKVSAEEYQDSWAIDHDHSCCSGERSCGSCVRGLLCRNCNVGLGYFRDDISSLESALTYLRTKS